MSHYHTNFTLSHRLYNMTQIFWIRTQIFRIMTPKMSYIMCVWKIKLQKGILPAHTEIWTCFLSPGGLKKVLFAKSSNVGHPNVSTTIAIELRPLELRASFSAQLFQGMYFMSDPFHLLSLFEQVGLCFEWQLWKPWPEIRGGREDAKYIFLIGGRGDI